MLLPPQIWVFGRWRWSYRVCGAAGYGAACIVGMFVSARLGLEFAVTACLAATAALAFVGLALAVKAVTGKENIVCYHHVAAVLWCSALLLKTLGRPVLAYLDVIAMGIAAFLAFGRVGCLLAGCCYGRPNRCGVRYGAEHAALGFPSCLVRVPLFPVQAAESLWLLCIVAAGLVMAHRGEPGALLALFTAAYGFGRFCLEFARGDPDRPYLWGFSEAQWTSVLLMLGVLLAELKGALAFHAWHAVATASLILIMIGVSARRHLAATPMYRLLHPRHVTEVAEALMALRDIGPPAAGSHTRSRAHAQVRVMRTSLGIQISSDRFKTGDVWVDQYSLSQQSRALTEEASKALARLILQLRRLSGPHELVQGNWNTFHLLAYSPKEVRP